MSDGKIELKLSELELQALYVAMCYTLDKKVFRDQDQDFQDAAEEAMSQVYTLMDQRKLFGADE